MSGPPQPRFEILPFAAVAVGPRYLVAHLPAFALERCGWSAEELVVLVALQQSALRVVACSPAAVAAGLFVGMRAAEARARLPEVVVAPWDEVGEAADRVELVRALEPLCDRIAALGSSALVLEISACTTWYGSEAEVAARVRARLGELGHRAHVAVADHPQAARALACVGREEVVAAGEGAWALAALPLEVLAPSEGFAEALATLGLRTVGQLARLDAASVAGRWGAEGVALHRVARGLPGPAWMARPVPLPLERVRITVEEELADREAVALRLDQGLVRLRDQLAARELVAAVVEVRLELAWGPSVIVRARAAHPTRDPVTLGRLLRDRLTPLTLEAPVCGLLLHAHEVAPDDGGQRHLIERREGGGRWSELVARLSDVLGDDAVFQAQPAAAWQPERTWVPRAILAAPPPASRASPTIEDPVELQEGAAWCAPRPRPTLLRSPPLPVNLRVVEGRPVALLTRQGAAPIRRARGPELLSGGWWEASGGFQRSYWVVEVPEGAAWVFEEGGAWFLHGWFD